jgi:ATP-dependent protease ClpP protease subunit
VNENLHIEGIIASQGEYLEDEKLYTSAKDVQDFLQNATSDEITVELNTPGGSVSEGFIMYDLLKASGKKIKTIAYQANSIGSIIFLAGEQRLVSENAELLIHNAWLDPQNLLGMQLNAAALGELKQDAELNDAKILNTYTSILGKDKEQELIALMASDTILNADKAIELGFATGKINSENKVKSNKSMAFLNYTIQLFNETQMKKTDEKVNKFEAAIDKFLNMLSGKAKNMVVELENGTKVFVDTDTEDIKGKRAFLVENDQPTDKPAPNGDHKLKDGRVITVADGLVSEVKEAAPTETVEAVKKQMDEMKASYESKIVAMEEEKKKYAASSEVIKAEAQNLKKQFDDFKNKIAADPEEEQKEISFEDKFKNVKREQMSESEKIMKRILTK